jgi:hypothetical protein
MSKEAPPPNAFQIDLFSGELVDTRAASQKRKDAERILPRQPFLFSQREIAQFGVNANPLLPIADTTRLVLGMVDSRTEEEKARDTDLEAQRRTIQLFPPEQSNGVYCGSIAAPPITDPRRLLAATSVVPDRAFRKAEEFERLKRNIEHDMHEKHYLLCVLFQR